MKKCPQCSVEIVSGALVSSSCGLDLAAELEATRLSDDRKGREPTEVMPEVHETSPTGGFAPGTVLAGRYRLMTSIGKGGMGEVYKAEDIELDQAVAIKFLPASIAKDEAALKRFRNEVRTARQISHPNVCRVFDIAEANGVYFISMEYVDGDDLSMLLRRIGRLPSDKALETSRQICFGLHAIHDAGILHRDLKPANVIIDSKGKARITDFGIAGIEADISEDDLRSGTPAYMSPEQLDGKSVTQKSDIYSLGLLLYEIFTGKQAIKFDSFQELLVKRHTTTPTNPSEILKDIDPLVEKTILQCLEKNPEDRPNNALQVALMLPGGNPLEAAVAAGETPSPAMVAAAPKKGALSQKAALAALAGIILLLIFTGIYSDTKRVTVIDEKSTEVLAVRARAIAANLGYTEPPLDSKYSTSRLLGPVSQFSRYVKDNPGVVADPTAVVRSGRAGDRAFRYRQSQRYLAPLAAVIVSANDPPFMPGDIRLSTDAAGKLTMFEASPIVSDGTAQEKKPVNWDPLFIEAGLDPADFVSSPPVTLPSVFADDRAAWTGPFPQESNITLRVEAAAYDGKPVFFRVIAPWDDPGTAPQNTQNQPPFFLNLLGFLLSTMVVLGIVVLSWHNFRAGRGDMRGTIRIMLFLFAVMLLRDLTRAQHIPDLEGEWQIITTSLMHSLFYAVIGGLMYSALEPQIRRVWPELLISWSRLLGGDIRNPMVGRDILLGGLVGCIATILFAMRYMAAHVPDTIAPRYPHESMVEAAVSFLDFSRNAIGSAFGHLFIIFIFVLIFRRRWAGTVAGGILLFFIFGLARPDSEFNILWLAILLVMIVAFMFIVWRFGVLGMMALMFFSMDPGAFTFNRSSVYFTASITIMALLIAVAAYAAHIAAGRRAIDLTAFFDTAGQKEE